MSKEKQLQEMSSLINDKLFTYLDDQNLTCDDVCNFLANDILKHYQPKLPKDSVVLTKSQYDMLIASSSYEGSIDQLKNTVILSKEEYEELLKVNKADLAEQASYTRKETVDKIYRSYEKEYGEFYNVGLMLLKIIIKEQFGIEF